MPAKIIDGKTIAAGLRARVADEVARLRRDHRLTPGLAVVLVGNDPASEVYVRNKHKQTQAAGMDAWRYSAQGVSVALRVTPRGGRDDIDGIETLANGRAVVKMRVRAIAEGGEANRAVTELLARALVVPKARVRILSGVTSRLKHVAIDGDPAKLGEALRKLTTAKKE